jgi:23S rRNA (guanosine2251-2'-O)-methyltransferase
VGELVQVAKQRGLAVQYVDKGKLSQMAGDSSHQGMVLETDDYPYSSVEEMLALAQERGEKPFLLLLDLVQGVQNIGMLLRTAEACGVHGVIMQDRRAPEVTPHIVSFAAGATEHLLIAKETNLVQVMRGLKERNVWIVGLDVGADAQPLGQVDLNMAVALVVGNEGDGVRRLVRQECDLIMALPMRGRVASLNAAVTGSVALYAAWQARGF